MSYKISDKNSDKDIINYVPGHVSVLGQFTNLSEKTMLGWNLKVQLTPKVVIVADLSCAQGHCRARGT